MEAREILLFLSTYCNGKWESIYGLLTKRESFSDDFMKEVNSSIKSKYVTILDHEYPSWLKNIYRPPFVLYYYGDFSLMQNLDKNIAVIGSRDFSDYGKKITQYLVKDICARYIVVSGMAVGIDTIAQEAAIQNGGKTIAVLGSGIDYCYPASNRKLYEKLKKEHLVISEYPNATEPCPDMFPFRNRIIAALSKGVLVTEAHEHSGTLITVEFALNMGKDVMCVPYHADEKSSCNDLISCGAFLVQKAEDIFEVMDGDSKKSKNS